MIKFAKLSEDSKIEGVYLVDDYYHGNAEAVNDLLVGKFVQVTDPNGNFLSNLTEQPRIAARYVAETNTFTDLDPLLTTEVTLDSLNARLSALEADEISDDATSSALITLIAGLATRITALEGGN